MRQANSSSFDHVPGVVAVAVLVVAGPAVLASLGGCQRAGAPRGPVKPVSPVAPGAPVRSTVTNYNSHLQ